MFKKIAKILLIIIGVLAIAALIAPRYVTKALIYTNPNIDDYKIFANRSIATGQPLTWAKDSLYNAIPIDTGALKAIESYETVAYVVTLNNKLLYERYWDGSCDSCISNSFSMSKSIVGLLIGCLLDEGKIKSLDQPVTDYLPEFKGKNTLIPTLKNLLTMSSGIKWDESYSSLFSPITEAYYGNDITAMMYKLEVNRKPGAFYEYQGCNTQLLAMIIEKITEKPLTEYASEKLWKPLGAEHPALWSLDKKNGMEKASCCFNSAATDFARFGQLINNKGTFNGNRIVSESYLAEATTPASYLKDEHNDSCNYYGYQIWMTNYKGHKVIYFRGILGQYVFAIPDLNAVVVRLGEKRSKEYTKEIPNDVFLFLDTALQLIEKRNALAVK